MKPANTENTENKELKEAAKNADLALQEQSENTLKRLLEFFARLLFGVPAFPQGESSVRAVPMSMESFNTAAKHLGLDQVITDPKEKQAIVETMNQATACFNQGDTYNATKHLKTLAETFLKHADQVIQEKPILGRIAKPLAEKFIQWADKTLGHDSPTPKPAGKVSALQEPEPLHSPGPGAKGPVKSLDQSDSSKAKGSARPNSP